MKTNFVLPLAFASASVLVASLAQAAVVPLSPVPAGTYGDKGVATLEVEKGSASLILPCAQATFGAIDFDAENGKFSVSGSETSALPESPEHATPVVLTGTVSNCEPDGVCRTSTAYITATLENAETGVVLGHYAFRVGAQGVEVRCQ